MSNPAIPASADGPTDRWQAALGRWSADSLLAPLVAPGTAGLLVLDGSAERILYASATAAPLRAALADASGRLHPALALAEQVRRLGPLSGKPRVARLRLDPRGIAPGVTCQIARASFEEAATVLLVAPLAAARPVRAQNGGVQPAPAPEPAAAQLLARVDEPIASGRLIWRSDAEGVLTQVSGAGTRLATALLGQSWQALCAQADPAEAEALLAALREKRTFRALPLTMRLPSAARATILELSGAPSGRANSVFPGFAGFAALREGALVSEPNTPAIASSEAPASIEQQPEEPIPLQEASSVESATPVLFDSTAPGERVPVPEPASELSTDEHAAFREIARALGARFAGDAPRSAIGADLPPSPSEPSPKPSERVGTGDALAGAFERLPAAILVHRGREVLFANRCLLDVMGYADLQALRVNESRSSLTAPASPDGGEAAVVLTDGSGGKIRITAERSSLDWQGEPATLVLVRPAPEPAVETPPAAEEPDPQALLDGLQDGVVTLDADGHVLRLNPKAESILAETAPQVVGKRFASILGPNLASGDDTRNRVPAPEPNETPPRQVSVTPLRERIGRLLSSEDTPLYATLQDMADAKRVEEDAAARRAVEEAARRKLAFFAKAGEGFRGPLNGIVGIADAMLAEPFGPLGSDRYRDHLNDIRAAGGHVLGQLSDLVELAEIEAGRIDLAFVDLALNALVSRCIAELQPQAAQRRILLRTSLAEDLQALQADERSLRSAAIKVLGNAIRLTDAGGQVIVSTTRAEAGDIALRVRDTGTGMSPEEVDRALDPFRQPRLPGTEGHAAAGLGLTLTRALVEANRGSLRVTSRKDEGTLVEMIFPGRAASA